MPSTDLDLNACRISQQPPILFGDPRRMFHIHGSPLCTSRNVSTMTWGLTSLAEPRDQRMLTSVAYAPHNSLP